MWNDRLEQRATKLSFSEEYLANRGRHHRVWVIPCPSEERAEALFAYLFDFMEFLAAQ